MADNEDTKVVEAKNQGKNPVEVAINKMKEAKAKEVQAKIDAQVKVCLDADIVVANAIKVAESEQEKLYEIISSAEAEKQRLAEFGKTLK